STEMFSLSRSAFETNAESGFRAGGAAGMVVLQEHDSEFPRYHFAFTVDESDLERAATVLRECGVPTRGPISHDWIPGTSRYFEDLDGHELELFASST